MGISHAVHTMTFYSLLLAKLVKFTTKVPFLMDLSGVVELQYYAA